MAEKSLWRRFSQSWNNFFAPDDLSGYIIITAMLLIPPLALRTAGWLVEMQVVAPLILLSTLFGLILARSQFTELMALLISMIYGISFVLLAAGIALEDGSVYAVFIRITDWLVDLTSGGINQDDLVLTILVASLFWMMAYNAAWHVFHSDHIWRVIVPPALILMAVIVFYDGSANIDLYMVGYVFLALLLVVRASLISHEAEWFYHGINRPQKLRRQFVRVGAMLSLLPLAVGASIPTDDLQQRLDNFQTFLQSDPITELSEFWNRMFSPIEAQGPTTSDYYGGNSLDLGGAIRLGDQDVFYVEAPPAPQGRYYWRSRVFDTYEAGRWTPAVDIRLTDASAPLNVTLENTAARQPVEQQFTVALNATRIVYTAPQPFQINLATRSDLFYTAPEGDPTRTMNISVIRPMEIIREGGSYTATSLVSTASANQLRLAGVNYPDWVRQRYLYLSPSVSQRTVDLAQQIVADTNTPYDTAKAIERWLRANIAYNESIPAPPPGQDPVDWLLFDQREGYCNYYASAMIVMLRSQGIPARLAAGFSQGRFDGSRFVVTERDAHTWVEAYFPGFGWIEFEPTAAQQPLDRQGDDEANQEFFQPPAPTPTPLPTSTPLPTNTPLPTDTPPAPDEGGDPLPQPTVTPSVTPTPSPTPTATPVVVPTIPPPITPEPGSPLDVILPALGLLLLGLFVLLLLIALFTFIWWWWEWRGLNGLSPVARAYARLERYLGLVKIRLNPQDTPDERRHVIVQHLPQARRSVTAITRLYINERYGPGPQHPAQAHHDTEQAEEAWLDARGRILGRWLRRFIPWGRDE